MNHEMTVDAQSLCALLRQHRFRYQSEADLQAGIAKLLTGAGISHEREVALSPTDRPDFLVGDVAVEVKVDGALTSVIRQLHRYAQHERVASIVLVTTRMQHLATPHKLNEKRVRIVHLVGSVL